MERRRIETADRPPGRPRSAAADEAILDATMSLLREVGYDALALEAVAARAGVGKATLYRRWSSREALVTAAIRRFVATLPTPDTGDFEEDVVALLLVDTALYADPDTLPFLSALVAAMARSATVAEAVRTGFHAVRRDAMRTVLRRGIARGELPRDADLELVMDLLHGPFFFRATWTGAPVDAAFARELARAVLRSFRGRR